MAPSDKRNGSSDDHQSPNEPENPFTAFQRFVDEQMSSMLQSFVGLPSSTTYWREWQPWKEIKDSQKLGPWDWSFEGEQHKANDADSTSEPLDGHRNGVQDTSFVDEGWRSCPYSSGPTLSTMRLARFLRHSPYSPTNLELDPQLHVFGSLWRQAFEDLMDETQGRSMPPNTRPRLTESLDRHEWARQLLQKWAHDYSERGYGKPLEFPAFGGFGFGQTIHDEVRALQTEREQMLELLAAARRDGFEKDESNEGDQEGVTELDVYERMLGLESPDSDKTANTTPTSPPDESEPPAYSQATQERKLPSIIGTLTTVERVTLPDGSVRTKRVLKKRFADGREESNESEEVELPESQRPKTTMDSTQQSSSPKAEQGLSSSREEKKRGGWFWS